MTRRGHKRAAPGEHFVLVPEWILVSDRWHALSVDARAIAIDICMRWNGESKPKFRIINNNGSIHYGCREAARVGIKKDAAAHALNELLAAGFLDPGRVWEPGFLGDGKRRAREFRITFLPTHGHVASLRNATNNTRRVLIEHRLLKSAAYRSMPSAAKVVLLELIRRENGSNNGRIRYGADFGPHIGLSADVTKRALRQVQDRGFIVISAAANKRAGVPRKWRLTTVKADGKAATTDFLNWRPKNGIPVSLVPLKAPDGLAGAPKRAPVASLDNHAEAPDETHNRQVSQGSQGNSPARSGPSEGGAFTGTSETLLEYQYPVTLHHRR
jgi:hypothetical protein